MITTLDSAAVIRLDVPFVWLPRPVVNYPKGVVRLLLANSSISQAAIDSTSEVLLFGCTIDPEDRRAVNAESTYLRMAALQ